MTRALSVACFVACIAAGLPAGAIVIRHDRPSERYEELAAPYAAVVDLRLPGGAGTLIAPEWVLTAAHAVTGLRPGHELGLGDGGRAAIAEVHSHPGGQAGRDDLALLRLARPVRALRPLPLYRGDAEAGSTMVFVGRGGFGDGLTGPGRSDRKLRAATNRVERVGEKHLEFRFDPPETATDLEGISGPGDSGGPALLVVGAETFVAGVSSGQDSREQRREGVYGVREFYMRVAAYLDWIDATVGTTPASADRAPADRAAAERSFAAGEWARAAEAYAAVAAAEPEDGQAAFRLGLALLRSGRQDEAMPPLRRAAELGFQAPMAHFLAAGVAAGIGRPEEAWSELERAVAAGFAQPSLLDGAPELAPLRGSERFATLVAAATINAEPCRHEPEYGALAFWEGEWEVWMSDRRIAESIVERGEGSCLWTETYLQDGADARLTLYWHPGAARWRGIYVDERGGVGEYSGEVASQGGDGGLTLLGTFWRRGQGDVEYRLRIAPLAADRVEVVGESRATADAPWSGRYQLDYRRRAAAGDPSAPG